MDILELLKKQLVDWALDKKDKELFLCLTSDGWEEHVLKRNVNYEEDSSGYYVFCEEENNTVKQYIFDDMYITTVFVVHEKEWDEYGWRDRHGLSFRDRLTVSGNDPTGKWNLATGSLILALKEEFRVIHPIDLIVSLSNRR